MCAEELICLAPSVYIDWLVYTLALERYIEDHRKLLITKPDPE